MNYTSTICQDGQQSRLEKKGQLTLYLPYELPLEAWESSYSWRNLSYNVPVVSKALHGWLKCLVLGPNVISPFNLVCWPFSLTTTTTMNSMNKDEYFWNLRALAPGWPWAHSGIHRCRIWVNGFISEACSRPQRCCWGHIVVSTTKLVSSYWASFWRVKININMSVPS